MNRPHTNTFITNIHAPNLRSKSRLNRRTYRGNNFVPNISNYYKQSANNSKKIQSLGKTFEKIAADTEQKFRNTNMKQKLHNEMKQRKMNENARKAEENIENTQMRQKLQNEMRQIENDEIKRKARRTQKQINNENRQEKEERNQLQREIEEEEKRYQLHRGIQEKEDNLFANYPTIENFGKPGAKETISEHLIQFMSNNPNHPLTKYLKHRYGNGLKGSLGILHGIGNGNKPLYNESTNLFRHTKKPVKKSVKKTVGKKTKNL